MTKPSTPPPPVGGNGKYIALLLFFVVGIAGLVLYKKFSDQAPAQQPPQVVSILQSATPHTVDTDEVPLPPEIPDAASNPGPTKVVNTYDPCAVKACGGKSTDDLEHALQGRAMAAKKCYNQLLSQDNTLKGQVKINVRVSSTGQVCAVGVVSNETGNPAVERCATNPFRGVSLPSPKGGCVDIQVPMSFVPSAK